MSLLIRGGRVVDPSQEIDALRDIRIDGDRIVEIGEHLEVREGAEVFDATNAVVAPGFIDMHVHLREPGAPQKETIATGLAAAVAGGFTAVACMPNTNPALDDPGVLAEVLRLAALTALGRVHPIAAITLERAGQELAPYRLLRQAGAVAFSDDGQSVEDPRILRNAALYAREAGGIFISHCEDERLKAGAVASESPEALRMGLDVGPPLAEEIVVARDMLIAADTKQFFHIAHLSTAIGLELVRFAKSRGWPVSAEATPHHLLLDSETVRSYDGRALVNPPLRSADDARALRAGVREGTIEVLASDHAPHTLAEKSLLPGEAPFGFSGLEIAIGAYAAALTDLPLSRFIALCSMNPARLLGVDGGTLGVGSPADVTVFAERTWTVDASRFHSKGRNTPFDGATFHRRAIATIVGGRMVMRDGVVVR